VSELRAEDATGMRECGVDGCDLALSEHWFDGRWNPHEPVDRRMPFEKELDSAVAVIEHDSELHRALDEALFDAERWEELARAALDELERLRTK
jgi:hypothetical protein